LYFCRFDRNGRVFLSDGSGTEWWGQGGSDADTYDVPMTEVLSGSGQSRHYTGVFNEDGNILTAGVYRICIYLQDGGSPADTDLPIGRGELYWDGSAEVDIYTLDVDIDAIAATVSGIEGTVNSLEEEQDTVKNVYGSDEDTADGVYPRRILRSQRRTRI